MHIYKQKHTQRLTHTHIHTIFLAKMTENFTSLFPASDTGNFLLSPAPDLTQAVMHRNTVAMATGPQT